MTDQPSPDTTRITASVVPENQRETFLPTLFGRQHFLVAENAVYDFMSQLSPKDYGGGLWAFYALKDQPLYMAPPPKDTYHLICEGNGFEGNVSADAAGIIATLFTFSHLSFHFGSDDLSQGYYRLYHYAAEHPEARAIFRAID